jgi:NAD+ kinase
MSEHERPEIHTVGIVYRVRSVEAEELALRLVDRIKKDGRVAWCARRDDDATISDHLPATDLLLVLGGDGTILSLARLCAPLHVPLLGVNFGRVGFLTELEPQEVEEKLPLYFSGDCWLDERSMLEAEVAAEDVYARYIALNDIVLVRGAEPRVIQIHVLIDGHHYNTTVADGIIVSTATGSTAYNLAAGGPILHPQVRSAVLTPVAPHLAADRALILESNAVITLELHAASAPAVLSADGQINRTVTAGTKVVVRSNTHVTTFLRRRPPTYFYRVLTAKLRENL